MSDTQQAGLSDGPRGIAGWLILPPILLVLMILAGAFQLLTFNALAEAASGLPTPKIYLLSVIVVLSVALAIICPILLLVVLFRKMRRFPRLFLLWAAADRVSMKHRVQRPLPGAPTSPMNDVIAVVAGLAIYALFVFWAHTALIGMPLM